MKKKCTRQLSRDTDNQKLHPLLVLQWWINIPIKGFDLVALVKFSLCSIQLPLQTPHLLPRGRLKRIAHNALQTGT